MRDDALKGDNNQHFDVIYRPGYLSGPESHALFEELLNSKWRRDKISFFGKTYDQPRKVAFYGDLGVQYKYSGILMEAVEWSTQLFELKGKLVHDFSHSMNTCLVNLYRNGKDYMSWHSDDEAELGESPVIYSLSLGASRDFIFKHRFDKDREKVKYTLHCGDLLIMKGRTQEFWHHALPKRLKVGEPRINLTFRNIIQG